MAAKKKAARKAAKVKRYSDDEKNEVVSFVEQVNNEKGRGGIAAASKKFGVTPLSISTWIKRAGGGSNPAPVGAPKKTKVARSSGGVWEQMVALKDDIDRLENEAAAKRAQFDKLKKRL